ncbi:MAG TPA: protoporphyrinogen oxidase [Pirellulales bacterium]|nr:protoporphyrinogen oxidase [Pirellulales bacterium]
MTDSLSTSPPPSSPRRFAVIGGGISGLAAAHRLTELDPAAEIALFEAGEKLGGVLQTSRCDGYLLDHSADNFITNVPWALDLCRRIGLENELVPTRATSRRAFVVRGGKLYQVPEGFSLMAAAKIWPVLATPILGPWGKLRLALEYFVSRRTDESDESLASFARRRLGKQVFERLVQPLVAGIYTADAERLSLAAALPRFREMERQHGSLIRAAHFEAKRGAKADAQASGARYSLFVAPREGLASLVDAIARRLPAGCVRLNSPVERLRQRPEGGWDVTVAGQHEPERFSAVIVAAPAPAAAKLLKGVDDELAADLAEIPYAGSAIALAGYRREQIAHALDGFGFVVPELEHRKILAASFSSIKFDGRAPEGRVLIRVFFGGAGHPEMVDLPDDELKKIVGRELAELLGAKCEPELFQVCRWGAKMPQYHVGHVELVRCIEERARALPDFALAGNAYHGVGVPQCIHSGEQAAERMARGL